jgi:hypothetical protein
MPSEPTTILSEGVLTEVEGSSPDFGDASLTQQAPWQEAFVFHTTRAHSVSIHPG